MIEGTDALENFDNSRDIFKVGSVSIKWVYPGITWHSEFFQSFRSTFWKYTLFYKQRFSSTQPQCRLTFHKLCCKFYLSVA